MTQSWQDDNLRNIALYEKLLQQHGDDVKSLNWGSRESQEKRFEVLAGIGDLAGQSILDVGCGLGDFCGWLRGAGVKADYTGLDITPDMIAAVRRKYPENRFICGDPMQGAIPENSRFDYVVASGIFYFRQKDPQAYMHEMIQKLYGLCSRGLAFNNLSSWADRKEGGEFFADPAQTLDFCRTLTRRLTLRHDYHPADFTIYMYKGQDAP